MVIRIELSYNAIHERSLINTRYLAIKFPIKGGVTTIRSRLKCSTIYQTFMVIRMELPYNAILERPLINTKYLAIKFLIKGGVTMIRDNQLTF
jgi:hypothetical protein